MRNVCIINLGFGSVGSLRRMIFECGYESILVSDPIGCDRDDIYVLPGVGSWDDAASKLIDAGWYEFFKSQEFPRLIGICLGFQLLFSRSNEGSLPGLELIHGVVVESPSYPKTRMGWYEVEFNFEFGSFKPKKYYHVHKFVLKETKEEKFGVVSDKVVVAVNRNNVYGFQFHPEKSHLYGKELLTYILGKMA